MAVVGSAELELTPELRRFIRETEDIADDPRLRRVGVDIGEELGQGATRGFEDDFRPPSARRLAGFASTLVVALGGALAAAGIGRLIGDSISEASDLGEATNKVKVVFGDASEEVLGFAETAATSFGLAESEALGYAGTLGNLLLTTGLNEDAIAGMSTELVGLAADLGSFNNVPTVDALEAIRAGLVGETEPLKRFGVNLNEATLKAEALRLGLLDAEVDTRKLADAQESVTRKQQAYAAAVDKFGEDSEKARRASFDLEKANDNLAKVLEGKVPASLDAATKAQAAYSLILAQTGTAAGDFGRTLEESLPNQLKVLGAGFTSLKAEVGEALLPIALDFVKAINQDALPALGQLAEAIIPALEPLGDLVGPIVSGLTGGLTTLAEFITELPGQIDEARQFIELAGDAFTAAFSGEGVTSDGLIGAIERVGVIAGSVVDAVGPIGQTIIDTLGSAVEAAGPLLSEAFGTLVELAAPFVDQLATTLGPLLSGLGGTIADTFGNLVDTLGPVFAEIGPLIGPIVSDLSGLFGGGLLSNVEVFAQLFSELAPILGEVAGVLGGVFAQTLPLVGELLAAVLPVIQDIKGVFLDLIVEALPPFADALLAIVPILAEIGGEVLATLIGAFAELAPILLDIASALGGALLDILPSIAQLFETLVPVIAELVPVLAEVLTMLAGVALDALLDVLTALLPVFQTLADVIAGPIGDALAQLAPVIGEVASILGGVLARVIQLVARLFTRLAPVLDRLIPPLGELVATLAGALGDILLSLAEVFEELFDAIEPLIPVIIDVAAELIEALVPIITELAEGGALEAIAEAAVALVEALASILIAVTPLLPPLAELLGLLLNDAVAPVIVGIATAIGVLAEALAGIVEFVAGVVQGIFGWFEWLFDVLVGNSIVPDLITAIIELFFGLPAAIVDALGDLVDDVVEPFLDLASEVFESVTDLIDDILDAFTDLPGDLLRLLGDIAGAGLDLGSTLIQSFVDGLTGLPTLAADLLEVLGGVFADVWNTFIDTVNAGVPNKIDLPGPVDINLPDNPFGFLKLATGGIVPASAGGTAAIIGEGGQDEAVIPLPDGLIDGLRAIANGAATGGGLSIGQIVAPSPERAAQKVATKWRKLELLKG